MTAMGNGRRRYVCPGAAVALILVGTLATGLLPSTALYQALAGGLIVAGFGVLYLCLGGFDLPE
jgi:hypothetical protein